MSQRLMTLVHELKPGSIVVLDHVNEANYGITHRRQ
jgi:hypothetical protein